ncbi:O-antigen polysaccharide polymerase Wzy [Marinilactibacillus psychrotolerans]|uniref:O-antigen polysaccharide polymerase Wzy n=1 Tax=Marinilactibacillus psychrotolerans TaxID=191770 RepID=A0AAV3WQK6_9LACT|nr:O-antigen polysaccharide polymerase Wzy [Marinilactibacillus psychrotolerans]GEL67587.1 hypothetical protein MPS01_17420 [Marinilactibacillus psychrotolerans]GEQ35527.1 hypothetical protein M132T_10350 [Marinilactibacillus psychrotolerans]SDD08435.1 oligosaccharide repeat unit polymerase [Marinilactibacillus psychrotolerans]
MNYSYRKKNINFVILINIIVIVSSIILGVINLGLSTDYSPLLYSIISIICVIWCFSSWMFLTKERFSPYIIFLLSCFLFWLGQTFLYALNIRAGNFELYYMYGDKELLAAEIFTCIGFLFLHLGALLNYKFNSINEVSCIEKIEDKLLVKSMKLVIIPIFLFSGIGFMLELINKIETSVTTGYRTIYEDTSLVSGLSNIINSLDMFFIPSLFTLFVVYKHKKNMRNIFTVLVFFIFIGNIIIGLRGYAFALIISFIWLYSNQVKKFKTKHFLMLMISGVIGLVLISVVSDFRNMSDKTIQSFFTLISDNILFGNPIFESIAEFGGSMFPMIETMNIVNHIEDFGFGTTYISSILAIIPSALFGGYSFAEQAALATWLKESLSMNYGPGYSLIAEAYYNFGWFGTFFMSILGFLIIKVLYPKSLSKDKQILKNIFVAISIFYLVIYSRSSVLLLVRYLFYSTGVLYVLIMIVYNHLKSRYRLNIAN